MCKVTSKDINAIRWEYTMSRAQLALRVSDLEESIKFYSQLFDAEPAKRRPGYANFAITEPPLKLVLIEGQAGEETRMDHLGVEVASTDDVAQATDRLKTAGLATFEENDTSCCYALQDKVWVTAPGKSASPDVTGDGCCTSQATEATAAATGCNCD